jgi:hypothetical protein
MSVDSTSNQEKLLRPPEIHMFNENLVTPLSGSYSPARHEGSMKHDVFIIHAHQDKSIADAICGKLESAGLKCWIPTPETSAGEDRAEATRNAIGSSRVIVLVLSENANTAAHIGREITHAFYARRIIITFRLGETLPRRGFLFYLGNVPWVNAVSPPAEEHLEALTARIKGLMHGSVVAGNTLSPPRKTTSTLSFFNSWAGDLRASHYRTLGILKWVGIATLFGAVGWVLWFSLRQTKEGTSLAESRLQSLYRGSSVSPTSSPQAGGAALDSTPTFTRFGLWQAKGGATPLVQQGPQDTSTIAPAEPSTTVTSLPQRDVTPGKQAGGLVSEARHRHLLFHRNRVSHDHHQQYPGTQVKEARKIAALENRRDSLQSQLKATEAKLLAIQKNADLVASQRDALQSRLKESEEKTQIAQKNADTAASELEALRYQLKETKNRALTAQKNEELAISQRDALQSELGKARERAQAAEMNANLTASLRDAMEAELKKKEEEEGEKAQLNRRAADLAQLPNGASDAQFQEVKKDAQPADEDGQFVQTQPPNPGQNAKPAPLTQTLESTGPLWKLTK